jgi:DNA-binding PadR family transcriptional regulator
MWPRRAHGWGRRGWLRPWILGIVKSSPKNGAEIIEQIEQMSLGWRPSPGSVYPLLEELATEGLIRRREDGRYETTSRGRESFSGPWEFFGQRPASVAGVIEEMRANVAYLEDLAAGQSGKVAPHLKTLHALADRLHKIEAR